jgi:hypothetical protein
VPGAADAAVQLRQLDERDEARRGPLAPHGVQFNCTGNGHAPGSAVDRAHVSGTHRHLMLRQGHMFYSVLDMLLASPRLIFEENVHPLFPLDC